MDWSPWHAAVTLQCLYSIIYFVLFLFFFLFLDMLFCDIVTNLFMGSF